MMPAAATTWFRQIWLPLHSIAVAPAPTLALDKLRGEEFRAARPAWIGMGLAALWMARHRSLLLLVVASLGSALLALDGGYLLRCLLDGHLSVWRLGLFAFLCGALIAAMKPLRQDA